MMRPGRLALAILLIAACVGPGGDPAWAADAPPSPERVSYFRQVRPILQESCQGCHQPAKREGGLDVTSVPAIIKGGESEEPGVVPGKPDASNLLGLVAAKPGRPPEMPKAGKPLSAEQVALVRRWIAEGARDDSPPAAKAAIDQDHPPVYPAPPIITSLAFSPDGTLLAVSGYHEVLLHKADGSGVAARLVGLSERIQSAVFSPDGTRLAVTGGSPCRMGEVQIWDVASRKLMLSHPVTFDTVYGASWSGDGKFVAFGCSDNTLRAIDAATGQQVFYQGAHNDWVLDTVFSTKGTDLVSVSRDGSMKLNEVATERFVDNITSITPGALKGGLITVDRHPAKDELLAAGADGEPKIYQMYRTKARQIGDDFNLLRKFAPLPGRVFAAAYSRDGARVLAASSDSGRGELRVYQEADAKLVSQLETPGTGLYAAAWRPDGKAIAAGGFDGVVRLVDPESGKVVKEFPAAPVTPGKTPAASAFTPPTSSGATPGAGEERLPGGAAVKALEVFPATIDLANPYAYRQLLVTAVLDSGERIDATRMAHIEPPAGLVALSPAGLVRPKADGTGELRCSLAGQTAAVPVRVSGTGIEHRVSFVRDVLPAMSKLGCNAGTCHGSQKGQNGFKLSLRGYDPAFDHRALTDDQAGRRYNRVAPDQSLMLLKGSGSVPHTGGVLTRPGEPYYEALRSWIANGAQLDLESPRVRSIEVTPRETVLALPGAKQQMAVLATYTDGSVRDVTAEAFLESSLTEVLTVDRAGLATAVRRGEAAVLVRYEGSYAVARVTVMGDRSGFVWKDVPEYGPIDALVYAKLKKMKIQAGDLCDDAEFLRRVYLDLTGLPPGPDEVRAFLADGRDGRPKRDEVVDRLIGSPAFVEYWTNKWADLLQVSREQTSLEVAQAMRKWIRQAVADNVPYDKFVRQVLTASGSTLENPAASYYEALRTPEAAMENSTQLFLAVRFNCNKCHDHPFERWTQRQYYQLAGYFAQVDRKPAPGAAMTEDKTATVPEAKRPTVEIIADAASGESKHPTTGAVVAPAFPFAHGDMPPAALPRRQQFAHWVASPQNGYFATSYVNRVWSYLMGVGLIEPVDDIRAGNPPSNPELLERLTADFVSSGFDTRELLRRICKSRVYQHSIAASQWNADDQTNYSHALARRLPAEVLYDALCRATGSASRLPGMAPGARAVEAADPAVELPDGFLNLFGRPPRESACECERKSNVSLGQALNLINGPTVAEAIADPQNAIAKLVAAEKDDKKVVEELFLRVLCRPPTEKETAAALGVMHAYDEDYGKVAARVADYEKQLDARQPAWERQYQGTIVWHEVSPAAVASSGGATLTKQEGAAVLASGNNPDKDKYTVTIDTDLAGITGVRLEALADPSLPAKGPGRAPNGNFVLNELAVTAAPKADPSKAQPVPLQNARADYSQGSYEVTGAIDGNIGSGWAVAEQFGRDHVAVFETREDAGLSGGTRLVVTLDQQFGGQHTIGRFRLSLTTSPRPLSLKEDLPKAIAEILAAPADKRTDAQRAELTRYFRSLDPEYQRLAQGLAAYTRWSGEKRVIGAQDVVWALVNTPAFLFNR